MIIEKKPTACGGAGSEDPFNFWIHHDAYLPLVLDSSVSGINPFPNPVFEFLANNGLDDVGDVGTRQLENLFVLAGQSPHGLAVWMALSIFDEVLDGQVVKVRHLDHLHLITADAMTLVAA